jgi:lysyl-tRNA synthetase, class I
MENPLWHIHNGNPPYEDAHLAFNILLNLTSVCNSEDKAVLWGFISRYAPKASPEATPFLDKLVGYAVAYYRDFVKPEKKYRAATGMERAAFEDLLRELEKLPVDAPAEDIQFQVYEVGKRHAFADLKAWFQSLYEVLFGTSQGPRMGTFIALYGIKETIALIKRALAGDMVSG